MQKKADDAQPSRSMGTAARVSRLEHSALVKLKSLAESTSRVNGKRGGHTPLTG